MQDPLSEGGEGPRQRQLILAPWSRSIISIGRPFRFNGKIERVEVNLDARMSALGSKKDMCTALQMSA